MNITLPKKSFRLSDASLGMDKVKRWKKRYRYHREGVAVSKKPLPRPSKKFKTMVIPPKRGWFPSTTTNFTFGFNDKPPEWYIALIPSYLNGSLWLSERHSEHFVLRVPKDRARIVTKILNRRLWFNGAKWMWYLRRKKSEQ